MTGPLSPQDRETTVAILRTHAAMQDLRVHEGMSVMGKLRDDPEAADLLEEMSEGAEELESDSSNLNRIADQIEAGAH